jgi:4-hydroxyacetophenone monooxygenase
MAAPIRIVHETKFDRCEPITEDDRAIESALRDAHLPSLMVSLVHLTGDVSLLRGEIRPSSDFFTFLADPQGGISEQQQSQVRALALDALRAYRNGGCRLPPPLSAETVGEMMSFITGQTLSGDYVDFLMAELALNGEDAYAEPIDTVPREIKQCFHVVIIGAGMSGLLAAIRLKEAGIPYTVIEKNADVGGTWFENTYPGCRVDSPNHVYSYSFEPNDWPQHFSRQEVLREYFSRCATEHGLRSNIRFNTEVEELIYDDAATRWTVRARTKEGERVVLEANAVISAVGQLNRPRLPDIPGRESFQGDAFHSAQWQHQYDLTGKRIAVIGTGASAFQFVPEIAKRAGEVVVFQRTPPWILPTLDYHADIAPGKHWLLNHVPYYAKWFRFWMFWRIAEGLLALVKIDPQWKDQDRSVSAANDLLRTMLTENIKALVGDDPELLAKATPHYPPGGKRMLLDNGNWLLTLKRDNVRVVTDPIEAITPRGVKTLDGTEYEVDSLIYGTGFQASHFLMPMSVKGRGGLDLHAHWDGDPRAYLGITIPGFPNLFCLYGPNTNIVVNGSIVFFSECEVRYIMGCLKLVLENGYTAMECKREVHDAYNEKIDKGNSEMAWGTPKVSSWYKNSKGRVTQNWPFTLLEFWNQTKAPSPKDYTFT